MEEHYLKRELYDLIQQDDAVFEFLQLGSLDGIWYWDLENREHEWMSDKLWEVLGFEPSGKEHSPDEWQDLIFEEDLAVTLENFERHCEDPSHPFDQVVRYRHQTGSTVWVRCRGIAIRNDDGKPVRLLGAHIDVTQQKLAEAALAERTEELEATNRRLTTAIEEIKLLQGLLSVCAHCKKIRDDDGAWQPVESFISQRTDADFSHAICPDCAKHHHDYEPAAG